MSGHNVEGYKTQRKFIEVELGTFASRNYYIRTHIRRIMAQVVFHLCAFPNPHGDMNTTKLQFRRTGQHTGIAAAVTDATPAQLYTDLNPHEWVYAVTFFTTKDGEANPMVTNDPNLQHRGGYVLVQQGNHFWSASMTAADRRHLGVVNYQIAPFFVRPSF
jgi:hypothetical protein